MQENKPDSPCINVCVLDPESQTCVGCFRNIDEIAGWSNYSAEQRARVYRELPARRAAHSAAAASVATSDASRRSNANARCERCGEEFTCGMLEPSQPCWCSLLPHISPPNKASNYCLCPRCLGQVTAAR